MKEQEKFIFDTQVHLQGIQVKVVYEGHPVKVEVTGVEKREISSRHPQTKVRAWSSVTATAVTTSPFQSSFREALADSGGRPPPGSHRVVAWPMHGHLV